MMTDVAAVSRARDGDSDAFRFLVERHSRVIFRVAYRMTGNEHDADDVVQETFLRAYRQLDHFEELPVEEIGKTLGIQVNAAKHTIFRAVRKLREALEPLVRSNPCST